MSELIKGKVDKIHKGKKAYAICIADVWYGGLFDRPSFKEGDTVEFEVAMNGNYKNVAANTLTFIEEGVVQNMRPAKVGKETIAAGKEDYWGDKAKRDVSTQKEIRFQASRNAAIAFADVLLKNQLVPLGTKKDKVTIVEELVNHYTNKFYNETVAVSTSTEVLRTDKPEQKSPPMARKKVVEVEVDDDEGEDYDG